MGRGLCRPAAAPHSLKTDGLSAQARYIRGRRGGRSHAPVPPPPSLSGRETRQRPLFLPGRAQGQKKGPAAARGRASAREGARRKRARQEIVWLAGTEDRMGNCMGLGDGRVGYQALPAFDADEVLRPPPPPAPSPSLSPGCSSEGSFEMVPPRVHSPRRYAQLQRPPSWLHPLRTRARARQNSSRRPSVDRAFPERAKGLRPPPSPIAPFPPCGSGIFTPPPRWPSEQS